MCHPATPNRVRISHLSRCIAIGLTIVLLVVPSSSAAPGSLDPTFDGDGRATAGLAPGSENAYAVALLPDNRIIVAGGAAGSSGFMAARLNSDGSPDVSFGGDGSVTTPLGSGAIGYAVALQADGKAVVAGYAYNGSYPDFAIVRLNTDGSLDPTFDGDGKVIVPANPTLYNNFEDEARGVAVQPDGKIVAAGFVNISAGYSYDFAVLRLNTNGTLDTSFAGNGKAIVGFGSNSDDRGYAVALQADGKIVIAGMASGRVALVRLNSDGSLDTGFDGDGRVTLDFDGTNSNVNAVAVGTDGRIVIAGVTRVSDSYAFALACVNADGSLDTTFDDDGKATVGLAGGNAYAVAIQTDGKIVAAGSTRIGGDNHDFALARLNADGSLDTSFDGDGKVITGFGADADVVKGIALSSDGKIVVGGYIASSTSLDVGVARYNSDGSLDAAFGAGGKVVFDAAEPGSGGDCAYAVAVQPDRKIVLAGYALGRRYDFAAARFLPGGGLDTGFAGTGKVMTDFGASLDDPAYSMAVQSDGKIVLAGYTVATGSQDFALARYNPDGTLDPTFDGDGRATSHFGGSERGYAIALQPDGKIVVAGEAYLTSNLDFALARYNSNGALDAAFGASGKVLTDFGGSHDYGRALALQEDGKIVVVGYSYSSNADFALARYNPDGALDTSFGTGGLRRTAIGTNEDQALAVAIQPDGKIVVAGRTYDGSNQDFAVARYDASGTLDPAFGSGGIVISAFGSGQDQAFAVRLQADGKILVAGGARIGAADEMVVARYNADGTLDTTFDGDGIAAIDFFGGWDFARAMTVQPRDGKIVLAGDTYNPVEGVDFAVARLDVAATSVQAIGDGASATLQGVTITNRSGATCAVTVTRHPVPPGGMPGDPGELPISWQLSTDCASYRFDLAFSYTDVELANGKSVTEGNLQAYRSPNDGYYSLAGGTVDTGANTVTLNDVTQLSWWALASSTPLAVEIEWFAAEAWPDRVVVTWETAQETDNQGFNMWRGTSPAGPGVRLNAHLIPSENPGGVTGASYEWVDTYDLTPGTTYYYWLEDVSLEGMVTRHGPVSVTYGGPTAVTLGSLAASPASGFIVMASVVALLALAGLARLRRPGS